MAIHVQDEETNWLVRDFARRRGVGITAAIKLAIQEASRQELVSVEAFFDRIAPLLDEVQASRAQGLSDQKAFMDEMWGERE